MIVVALLSLGNLFSINQSNISQTTDKLWNNIHQILQEKNINKICFDVRSAEYSDLINFKLCNLATKNNYQVYDLPNDSLITISILLDYKSVNKNKNYYLFTRETNKLYPIYLLKIIDKNQLIYSGEILFTENGSKKTKTNAKWYEPFMLSAVIGSLIYLIYYGNH